MTGDLSWVGNGETKTINLIEIQGLPCNQMVFIRLSQFKPN